MMKGQPGVAGALWARKCEVWEKVKEVDRGQIMQEIESVAEEYEFYSKVMENH